PPLWPRLFLSLERPPRRRRQWRCEARAHLDQRGALLLEPPRQRLANVLGCARARLDSEGAREQLEVRRHEVRCERAAEALFFVEAEHPVPLVVRDEHGYRKLL